MTPSQTAQPSFFMPNFSQAAAILTLEDGSVFQGTSFGYEGPAAGEVVFNTAMTGYPESLTDPSYQGQILVLTYPSIGNYGVPGRRYHNQLLEHFESDKIHIRALIIADYSHNYNHWNASESLGDWLKREKIPALCGIDTRHLTKRIRDHGSMLGKIELPGHSIDFEDPNQKNLVAEVSCHEKISYGNGAHNILLVDCGVKNNIIRYLLRYNTKVTRVPWDYDYRNEDYDGIFLSNGPGDPLMCQPAVNQIKHALQKNQPIFGICLGHQLLSLAAGADTYKLKFGHRSHNQPVIRNGTPKAYLTAQNHGYAVDTKNLDKDWEVFFTNLNDQSNEGIRHKSKPFFSTQFHPEASSGPTDTSFLFSDFVEAIVLSKKSQTK